MDNYFQKLWQFAPLSWAIVRATECELISKTDLIPPILEIGCGDGLFMKTALGSKKNSIDIGIDIDTEELNRAKNTGIYKKLVQVDITNPPFANNSFSTIIANGVLEHIPNLSVALNEIHRILKKNGKLITTSPTNNYKKLLFYSRLLNKFGLKKFAQKYENMINRIFAHKHLYNYNKWNKLFLDAGLKLENYWYYNNISVVTCHDLCLPFALFTKIIKKHTDSMILFPKIHKYWTGLLSPVMKSLIKKPSRDYLQNGSIFLVAKKK